MPSDADAPRFYNTFKEVKNRRNYLPHWQQDGATYFITFRQADAIPAEKKNRWHHERDLWLASHPKPWTPDVEIVYHQHFSKELERWLDAGSGSCVLGDSACRDVMGDACSSSMANAFASMRGSSCPTTFTP